MIFPAPRRLVKNALMLLTLSISLTAGFAQVASAKGARADPPAAPPAATNAPPGCAWGNDQKNGQTATAPGCRKTSEGATSQVAGVSISEPGQSGTESQIAGVAIPGALPQTGGGGLAN
jgi:hypothetical protein